MPTQYELDCEQRAIWAMHAHHAEVTRRTQEDFIPTAREMAQALHDAAVDLAHGRRVRCSWTHEADEARQAYWRQLGNDPDAWHELDDECALVALEEGRACAKERHVREAWRRLHGTLDAGPFVEGEYVRIG